MHRPARAVAIVTRDHIAYPAIWQSIVTAARMPDAVMPNPLNMPQDAVSIINDPLPIQTELGQRLTFDRNLMPPHRRFSIPKGLTLLIRLREPMLVHPHLFRGLIAYFMR